jgi:hypothetical protein
MDRSVPASFRQVAESRFGDEVDLIFITVSHPNILEPIRVVCDTKDFIYGGEKFIGFFINDIQLLTDDDQPPKAQLVIQNVDPIIGETIRVMPNAARLKIELLSSEDFDLTTDPRVEKDSEDTEVVYTADKLFLTNVKVDVLQISAEIVGWDYLQRVWPGQHVTKDLLPGAFR